MADRMDFPATVEEFMEQYKITDTEEVYTNGIELVPIFRMKQWFDRHPLTDVVQVVHAYWIQTSAEDEDGNAYYSCSNCGSEESHNPIVEVPYCWKCGAKMDAQGEE